MHEHNECEHNLKFCPKCDVVYCTKCKREWGGHSCNWYLSYPWYTYPYTTTVWPGGATTWAGSSTSETTYNPDILTTLTCDHLG